MAEANLQDELKQIDESIEELEQVKQFSEDLASLHEDERFQRVILQGYLETEAERLFKNLTTPMNMKRDMIENMMDKLGSIRDLKQYFGTQLLEADGIDEKITAERVYRKEVTERAAAEDIIDVEVDKD